MHVRGAWAKGNVRNFWVSGGFLTMWGLMCGQEVAIGMNDLLGLGREVG